MFPIEIYIILCCSIFLITVLYYFSKIKEFNLNFLKLIVPITISILFIIFFINYYNYVIVKDSYHVYKIILTFFSQLFLFISCGLYFLAINFQDNDIINLDSPSLFKSRQGEMEIGRVMYQNEKKHKFFLSLEDLEKHMFVCGATGTGKSNFVQNFLINFKEKYDIPFLLIEFKGEYLFLQKKIKDVVIFKPGEDFSINIFNPEGAHPEIHAERIFDILKSGQFLDEETEYSPQMQKVLVDILTNVCKDEGSRNWEGFYQECKRYLKTERKRIPMLAQTLISIRNRIRRFSIGPLKAIFSSKTEFKIKDLLSKNIIIDLSSIIRLGGEKEDAIFFLNMILKYLWDENLTKGGRDYKGIKHLTIVEDAQYFAPQDLTKQTKLTTYLEDIALLQRGTGECLISVATRPQVSEEILANCGVLVIFKSHMEKELQCELLNLDEINDHYLSILEKGRCLIRVNSMKRPFLLWNPYIHRLPLRDSEIRRNNLRILQKLKNEKNRDAEQEIENIPTNKESRKIETETIESKVGYRSKNSENKFLKSDEKGLKIESNNKKYDMKDVDKLNDANDLKNLKEIIETLSLREKKDIRE
ncbi:MAG: ATP-binding protein [Promethearchaeota archaeon]|nr:MAG: ATP-binding protein [Candidatus Lokiarchaeota archaeon]